MIGSEKGPQGWGVVKSLERLGCRPVVLIHSQKVGIKYKKPLYPPWLKGAPAFRLGAPLSFRLAIHS